MVKMPRVPVDDGWRGVAAGRGGHLAHVDQSRRSASPRRKNLTFESEGSPSKGREGGGRGQIGEMRTGAPREGPGPAAVGEGTEGRRRGGGGGMGGKGGGGFCV